MLRGQSFRVKVNPFWDDYWEIETGQVSDLTVTKVVRRTTRTYIAVVSFLAKESKSRLEMKEAHICYEVLSSDPSKLHFLWFKPISFLFNER